MDVGNICCDCIYVLMRACMSSVLNLDEIRHRKCGHGNLLCECIDDLCKTAWGELYLQYTQQLNGKKRWSPDETNADKPPDEPKQRKTYKPRQPPVEPKPVFKQNNKGRREETYQRRVETFGEAGAGSRPRVLAEDNAKRETRSHCGPYIFEKDGDKERINSEPLFIAVQKYYEVLGLCRCLNDNVLCDKKKMLRSKHVPWTRFPIRGGRGFWSGLIPSPHNWVNPYACRGEDDAKKNMQNFLNLQTMEPDYPEQWKPLSVGKWSKFWYAVDRLHEWVSGATELPEDMLRLYRMAFLYNRYECATKAEQYRAAGLLAPESVEHWVAFRYCREDDWPTPNLLNDNHKEEFMHFLLQQKRETVRLFEKVDLLNSLVTLDEESALPVRKLTQMDAARKAQFITDDVALRATRQQEQAAAAAAWPARKAQEDQALAAARTAQAQQKAQDEQEAVAAMLAMGGGAGGSTASAQRVHMLLQCLQRLAL